MWRLHPSGIVLGRAFYEAALYVDSRSARESAFDFRGYIHLRYIDSAALTNVATCCLHVTRYREGN